MEIRVPNNELLINESHANKYVFFLHNIPTSFLFSKFRNQCITDDCKPEGYEAEIIKESLTDLRNFHLYVQNIELPSMELGITRLGTHFVDMPHSSGKLSFSDLQMEVMNDEQWFVYRLLQYWMYAAHNPEEYNKWNEMDYYKEFYTSATLIILDNHLQKVAEFEFNDVHPSTVGQVSLTDQTDDKIRIPVTWIHTGFVPSDRFVIKKV